MQLSKLITLIFSICFLYSCIMATQEQESKIYALVINSKVKPYPPPSPPKDGDTLSVLSSSIIDSLHKVPINLAIFPFKYNFKIDTTIFYNNKYSIKELNYFETKNKVKKSDFIFIRDSIKPTLLTSNQKKELDFIQKNFDGVLYISKIVFNSKKTKAIVIIGYSLNKYSSSTTLFYLENVNENWKIIMSKQISVS